MNTVNVVEMSKELETLQALARHWGVGYDWRQTEGELDWRRTSDDPPINLGTRSDRKTHPSDARRLREYSP